MKVHRPVAAKGMSSKQWKIFAKKAKRHYKWEYEYKIMILLGLGDRYEISRACAKRLKVSEEIQNLMAAVCWKRLLNGEKLTSQKVVMILTEVAMRNGILLHCEKGADSLQELLDFCVGDTLFS